METMADSNREPDGWMIVHHRYNDSCHFGPFATVEEAVVWTAAHPEVRGLLTPLWLDVNWGRRWKDSFGHGQSIE